MHTTEQPYLGIVCGSGLSELVDFIENQTIVPYGSLPAFVSTTVSGHAGNFVFGRVGSVQVVVMQGRVHQYEGFTHSQLLVPMRVLKRLGVSIVLLTNAAGGLSENLKVGDFVVLKDHISPSNMCMGNVLVGPNDERFGPRFVATTAAYDEALGRTMLQMAEKLGMKNRVHEGVYFHIMGPTYASNAECKVMCMMGADVVGMSTVPEVIVARHCGLRVVAISLVTDDCNPYRNKLTALTHEEVLEVAKKNMEELRRLIRKFIQEL
ncbi:Purine nucleoside phosphorylase [Fasciolopsis buskii]|uniref:Purine nucleoside phosphorylase n=1 Tax=Fasciolopsis buskii TaxID=27845 RepID=A0A8E0S2T2_9TREM|nr:Purine nucleoside phosphorylase [Fasciolopsis buski]